MIIEIKIPSPGESITEVEIASWMVEDGDYVEKDQEIAEVESEKATLPLVAEDSGKVKILVETGKPIKVGSVACTIDTGAKAPKKKEIKKEVSEVRESRKETETAGESKSGPEKVLSDTEEIKSTPLARKMMEENHLSVEDIINGLRKIGTRDVEMVIGSGSGPEKLSINNLEKSRDVEKIRMSTLRRNLSKRLVEVRQETAMLTTFNEVDMSEIINLRKKYQEKFVKTHGVKLGFMSFFTKAVTIALQNFPKVNSQIEGEDMITPKFVDIAIAVQTDKGLMVPVIRNTEALGLADIEKEILHLAEKARKLRLTIEEMTGGTFTITNGGVFGSMLSTPIINPPQSAILGMHNIVERPVAINGKIEIRPIMYVALSYDHRVIDGRESVSFLVRVKELIENPVSMLLGNRNPETTLLGL